MSYRSSGGTRRGIPSSSANMIPLGGGGGGGLAAPPPAKRPRAAAAGSGYNSPTAAHSPLSSSSSSSSFSNRADERGGGGGYELAGNNAEKLFPDVREKNEVLKLFVIVFVCLFAGKDNSK